MAGSDRSRQVNGGVDAATHDDVVGRLRALGVVPGAVLVVHTAFSKVAPIAGGPCALIEALRTAIECDEARASVRGYHR